MSQTCCTRLAENTIRKNDAKMTQKLPSATIAQLLSGYIFPTKACIDNQKKNSLNSNALYMSPEYGELRPTNG